MRFSLAEGIQRVVGVERLPIGTIAVNVLGCVAIGFLSVRMDAWAATPVQRLGLTVGVLGGFTTFSSFSLNTIQLLYERHVYLAAVNVVASVALCLIGCWLGFRIAQTFEPAPV